MATRPTKAALAAALALAWVLGGCASEPVDEPTPPVTPSDSPSVTPTPTEDAPEDDVDALPPGFPDPESLIGKEAYDQQGADGWHTVVDGEPLDLALVFGACFAGGTGDVCGYSISGSAPAGPGGVSQPAVVGLLLLLRSTGWLADGTPTWVVVDAVIAHAPDGEPAYLDICDGADGVAIYADADAPLAATVPVLAAWGANAGVTGFVEIDPATLTCAYMGG